MPTTIALPNSLATRLQIEADRKQLSLDKLVIDILSSVFERKRDVREPTRLSAHAEGSSQARSSDDYPTLEEVVAKIKAMPPTRADVYPTTRSLADLLRDSPQDPSFDLEEWTREWDKVEIETKRLLPSKRGG